jgi:hypothetical protein
MRVLYLKLSDEDRALVEKIAARWGHERGRPMNMTDVIRELVHAASDSPAPSRSARRKG